MSNNRTALFEEGRLATLRGTLPDYVVHFSGPKLCRVVHFRTTLPYNNYHVQFVFLVTVNLNEFGMTRHYTSTGTGLLDIF